VQYLCVGWLCVNWYTFHVLLKMELSDWLAVTSFVYCYSGELCAHTHTHTHTQCNNMSHFVISICAFMLSSSLTVRCMTSVCVCVCVCVAETYYWQ